MHHIPREWNYLWTRQSSYCCMCWGSFIVMVWLYVFHSWCTVLHCDGYTLEILMDLPCLHEQNDNMHSPCGSFIFCCWLNLRRILCQLHLWDSDCCLNIASITDITSPKLFWQFCCTFYFDDEVVFLGHASTSDFVIFFHLRWGWTRLGPTAGGSSSLHERNDSHGIPVQGWTMSGHKE